MFQGGRFRSNDRGIGGEFHQACQRMVGAEKVRCYTWRVLGVKLSYLYLLFQDLVIFLHIKSVVNLILLVYLFCFELIKIRLALLIVCEFRRILLSKKSFSCDFLMETRRKWTYI